MIDFSTAPELELLRDTAARFASDHLRGNAREHESARGVTDAAARAWRDTGLGLLEFPGENGGAGLGALARVLVNEELGAADPGATLALDGCRAEHQGKRLLMVHGDDLLNGDRGYKILKSIIRNRLFVGTAKLLHPDFTYWAADLLSGTSRKLGEAGHQKITPSRSLRLKPLLDESVDILLFGHLHMAFHQLHESWEMVCLGDWIELFSYGELRDGRMRLLDDTGQVFGPEKI